MGSWKGPKMRCAALAVMAVAFVAGCGVEREGENSSPSPLTPNPAVTNSAEEKVAALEKDVAKLRNEVQQLRRRIEVDAKMRRLPENLRSDDFRARHSARRNGSSAMRDAPSEGGQNPATMTPEQRRAWHEERRRMFEDPAKMTPEQRRAWHEENRRMREDLSRMTPEQRRAWHEKRRRMREESRRGEKTSESGKQTSPDKEIQTNSDKQVNTKGETK